MDSHAFLEWLGNQLEILIKSPVGDSRMLIGRELVQDAFNLLDRMASEDILSIMNWLSDPSIDVIGDFDLPKDKRDDWDWVEGVLATIIGYEG